MSKAEQTTSPIFYDPTPAHSGPVWAWHAAPEWEKQAHDFSLFSIVEMHDPIMSPNSPFFDINAHKIWFSGLVDRWSFFVLQLGPPYAYRKVKKKINHENR